MSIFNALNTHIFIKYYYFKPTFVNIFHIYTVKYNYIIFEEEWNIITCPIKMFSSVKKIELIGLCSLQHPHSLYTNYLCARSCNMSVYICLHNQCILIKFIKSEYIIRFFI